MAYLDAAQQTNRPAAIGAVVAIHAGVGLLLVTGLSVTIEKVLNPPNPRATDIPEVTLPIPPEPVPEPTAQPRDTTPPKTDIYVPPAPGPRAPTQPVIGSSEPTLGKLVPIPAPGAGSGTLPPIEPPSPAPTFDPIAARPSNDRTKWVTQGDYRPSWIRREYTGTARFEVGVGTDGKVDSCSITRSSGHSALDDATCKLVTRRARFEPAMNSGRVAVKGSYSGSVRWELPE